MTINFAFRPTEFRTIAESATRAEAHIVGGPPVSMLASPWSRPSTGSIGTTLR